jgi:proteasome beta subunit
VTVILGLRCAEGLVIASDSQGTSMLPGNVPVKLDTEKVQKLGKHVLWAGTGAEGCSQRVKEALEPHAAKFGINQTKANTATAIHSHANTVQRASREAFVEYQKGADAEAWGGIFCGWSKDGPWIAEIDPNGGWQFHEPFAATGSGYAFAHLAIGSIRHYEPRTQTLEAAKAIAYRAIETTCDVSAFGVGMPVQLGVVLRDGAKLLTASELDETKELVNLWKAKEVDTLGEVAPKPEVEQSVSEDETEALDAPAEDGG